MNVREMVIREVTVAPGWNKADATALVDALILAIEREAYAKVRAAVEGIPSIKEVFGVTFDHHQVPQEAVLAAIDALMEKNDGR